MTLCEAFEVVRAATADEITAELESMSNVGRTTLSRDLRFVSQTVTAEALRLGERDRAEFVAQKITQKEARR